MVIETKLAIRASMYDIERPNNHHRNQRSKAPKRKADWHTYVSRMNTVTHTSQTVLPSQYNSITLSKQHTNIFTETDIRQSITKRLRNWWRCLKRV